MAKNGSPKGAVRGGFHAAIGGEGVVAQVDQRQHAGLLGLAHLERSRAGHRHAPPWHYFTFR